MIKRIIFLVLISFVTLTACLEDTYETKSNVDVYAIVKQVDNDTIYAIEAICVSNTQLNVVGVENESFSIDLEQADYAGCVFSYIPDDADFNSDEPIIGNYEFSIKYNDGTTILEKDVLEESFLTPLKLDSVIYDQEDLSFAINWSEVNNVDYYRLIIKKEDEIYFDSNYFTSEDTEVALSLIRSSWEYAPQKGDILSFQLHAYQLETYDSQQGQFQSISPSNIININFNNE